MKTTNSIDPRRLILIIVAIILTFIIIGLWGCEDTFCWECVTKETITFSVEFPGFPRETVTKSVLCDMSKDEIRFHEKEISSNEVVNYEIDGEVYVLTTKISVECLRSSE